MARRGNNYPRRQFVWARANGRYEHLASDGDPIDLLEDVRESHGDAVLRGATVMAVRGYLLPFVNNTDNDVAAVRIGFLVATNPPTEDPMADPEAGWFGFFPARVQSGDWRQEATWNHAGSPYGVNLRSSRKLEELGQSVYMCYGDELLGGDDTDDVQVDYDLSIGLKLP